MDTLALTTPEETPTETVRPEKRLKALPGGSLGTVFADVFGICTARIPNLTYGALELFGLTTSLLFLGFGLFWSRAPSRSLFWTSKSGSFVGTSELPTPRGASPQRLLRCNEEKEEAWGLYLSDSHVFLWGRF